MKRRRFWENNGAARERVTNDHEPVLDDRWIVPTAGGPIEYRTHGRGTPALVLPRASGGCDVGIAAARALAVEGFRLIAPSTFGPLRARRPDDPSPVADPDEAFPWAFFLDALEIERAPVVAFAEGARPAVQFASRHPDRVSALVLMVRCGGRLRSKPASASGNALWDWSRWSDVPMWLLMRMPPRGIYALIAAALAQVASLPPQERASLEETVRGILPVARAGSELSTPTLLISAEDDLYGSLPVARHRPILTAGEGSLVLDAGRHLLLGGGHAIWPSVGAFMRRASASGRAPGRP